ncbi:hypothetical protein NDU88_004095 [Pleurodeles waltl]|uniref:Uncharacterized protein n=1 Tax=Pleurodeles waltl TaxID=8319 RepID=A0AAV7MFM0_PLEWA|nr:hypothetical protein NDU88_004095 [Pleurodeles waltl]
MDRVLALMQPALMLLVQRGAEGNQLGGETPISEVDSAPDQGGRSRASQFTIGHMAPASVWVIGHSFVRLVRPFFNLYRSQAHDAGLRFLWIARGGLRLDGLRQLVEEVLRRRLPPPELIILYVGGTDLAIIGRRSVFEDLMVEISWLAKHSMVPYHS